MPLNKPISTEHRMKLLVQSTLEVLADESMLFDSQEFLDHHREVNRSGQLLLEQLKSELSPSHWRVLRRAFKTPNAYANLSRILGFGGMMTSYLLATESLQSTKQKRLVFLGALSNLIVTLFDFLVDEGEASPQGIQAVKSLVFEADPDLDRESLPPNWDLALELIQLYLDSLQRQSHDPAQDPYLTLQFKVIRKMLEAELATTQLQIPQLPRVYILRKSYLPFVLLGVPAWIGQADLASFSKLRWMFEVGLCIGMLDDLVDLEDDFKRSEANLILHETGGGLPDEFLYRRMLEIWQEQLRGCLQFWKQQRNHAADLPPWLSHALPLAIVSWLGGMEHMERVQAG